MFIENIENDQKLSIEPYMVTDRWNSLSFAEKSKLKSKEATAAKSFVQKNYSPIKRALKNGDWLALQKSEVLRYGVRVRPFTNEK